MGAVLFACVLVAACTDGTTPDCTSPEAGCSPPATTGSGDAAAEAAADAHGGTDSGHPVDAGADSSVLDAGDASD